MTKCRKCGHDAAEHYILIDDPNDIFFPLCGCRHLTTTTRNVSAVDLPITYQETRIEECRCQTRNKAIWTLLSAARRGKE